MNSNLKIQAILLLAFFMSLPFALLSQEEVKKEKKVTVKTIKEVDGKKIVRDTTFTVYGDEDVKEVVKTFTMKIDSDSSGTDTIDVMVDVDMDEDVEWTTDKGKKVIVMSKSGDHDMEFYNESENIKVITIDKDGKKKVIVTSGSPHGHKKVMKFKSGDGENEEIVIVSPHGKQHKSVKWVDENGEEYEYDFDMEDFHHDMANMKAEMKEMEIHIMDEEGHLHEELIELEVLRELEELDELKNMEVMVVPPRPPKPHGAHVYHDFNRSRSRGMEVSDKELRDAGIKNKADRLELDEININKDDGVIDLSFSLSEEGTPKVIVYNVYGDKVFNGKPELLNNKFETKIDLSKKQHGTYYLMIVVGSSSKTMRIHN